MFFCMTCGYCDIHCQCLDGEEDIRETEDAGEDDCPECADELEAILNGEMEGN